MIDSGLVIEERKEVMDAYYECTLTVQSTKSVDTYAFILNGDPSKGFEGSGQEIDIKSLTILDSAKLKKMSPCDLHEQLSEKFTVFVKADPKTGRYKAWLPMYVSTSKNRPVFKKNGKI